MSAMPGLGLVLDWAGLGFGIGTVYIVVTQAQLGVTGLC